MEIEFDELWDYDDPGKTGKKFLSILEDIKEEGNSSRYIQLLTQIARSQGLQFKFDDAHETLDEAESLINELSSDREIPEIRYLLERGRTFNSSGKKDKAKDFFLRAYGIAKKNHLDFFTIDAAHMLGIVTSGNDSLQWNNKAITLTEKTSDERAGKWLGSLYNNTGWTYHDMGEYEKALDLFQKNVKWHTERRSKQELIIAKWCAARALRSLNRVDEALNIQKELLHEIERLKLQEDGFVYEEIGECLLQLGKPQDSKGYFAKAFELLSKDEWLVRNEKERLERMEKLGT
jgi:tetratricopeptide (TPR) repeat protein